jgi:tetratricopeptide (TPR) repeat protein
MRRAAASILLFAMACAHDIPDRPVLSTWPMPAMSADARDKRQSDLAAARAAYEKNPNDADALIWVGRRLGYLGRYREAIDVFSEGAKKHPRDARMLRHRGHRWITLRDFDRAIRDLDRAAELVRGKPDQIEPDGLPNARNIPTSSLQSNIWYHLGLAHFLKGDFEAALPAYRACMSVSKNPDGLVSTSHWLYMTLRRLGPRRDRERLVSQATPHGARRDRAGRASRRQPVDGRRSDPSLRRRQLVHLQRRAGTSETTAREDHRRWTVVVVRLHRRRSGVEAGRLESNCSLSPPQLHRGGGEG